jgi:hypothetical protein
MDDFVYGGVVYYKDEDKNRVPCRFVAALCVNTYAIVHENNWERYEKVPCKDKAQYLITRSDLEQGTIRIYGKCATDKSGSVDSLKRTLDSIVNSLRGIAVDLRIEVYADDVIHFSYVK